jgi:putative ABC transport system permease protein
MIKHLIKLVWNRKRANFPIALEICFSFLALFTVIVLAVNYTDNYRRPLGFSYQDVWNINVDMKQASDDYYSPEQLEAGRQIYSALKEFDEIEAVAGAHTQPFGEGGSFGRLEVEGREIEYRENEITDDFGRVMGVSLTRGRWFGKEDDGADWRPVVINQQLAQALFGDEDPIDRDIRPSNDRTRKRVVGVVSYFRHGGEFSNSENLIFNRIDIGAHLERPPRNWLIKLRPGTTRGFEETLIKRLQDVAKQWSFEAQAMTELREAEFKQKLVPIIVIGLVAFFLMIMVVLGLTGVLWQSVTRRTAEIGLRRANGATVLSIYRQILGELLIITSFGLIAGIVVVVQFPLLNIIGQFSSQVYVLSIAISLTIIYVLTIICGLYPSWLAAKVQPAEALHYE